MNTKLHKKMDDILTSPTQEVEYWTQGSFTIAIIVNHYRSNSYSIGVAKCNLNYDECDQKRGQEIALARAVKKLARKAKK